MVNDPISDLIIRLKNAGAVGHESVSLPYSKFKHAVADTLKEAGFVKAVEKKGKKVRKTLSVELQYTTAKKPRITDVKRLSKPGRRLYRSGSEIFPIRYGTGVLVLSTPKGVMTGEQARKNNVGGEALFEIW